MATFTSDDVEGRFIGLTASLEIHATFLTKVVGGQPGGEEGVRAFVAFQMKLPQETEEQKILFEEAVRRILKQEVGEKKPTIQVDPSSEASVTAAAPEIVEVESYGVNVLRHSDKGVWLGDWMMKAMLKQAASRTGLFKGKIGTKGNFSEGGRVRAVGQSLIDSDHPNHVYMVTPAGEPVKTHFETFMGRVQTPKGAASIVHDSEVAPEGSRIHFVYRFVPGKVNEDDILSILAMSSNCGLGSVRSLECGKFRVDQAEVLNLKA